MEHRNSFCWVSGSSAWIAQTSSSSCLVCCMMSAAVSHATLRNPRWSTLPVSVVTAVSMIFTFFPLCAIFDPSVMFVRVVHPSTFSPNTGLHLRYLLLFVLMVILILEYWFQKCFRLWQARLYVATSRHCKWSVVNRTLFVYCPFLSFSCTDLSVFLLLNF